MSATRKSAFGGWVVLVAWVLLWDLVIAPLTNRETMTACWQRLRREHRVLRQLLMALPAWLDEHLEGS